jgi:hypothetical protein
MRKVTIALAALLGAGPLARAAEPPGLEEVISRHLEAHGGRERWSAIESLRITGTYRAFSTESPFTLIRKKDDKYQLDVKLDGRLVLTAYDGKAAWWDNHWIQPGARKIGGADLAVAMRDADFVSPFFDYQSKGWQVKLVGETEIEGIPAIGVELTRDDGQTETWYLDPKTYLEVARVSPGSDFGRPMPQRTFFDDFRPVAGVLIPYRTETQWYTRDRVMEVEAIEVNVPIDDALFAMPPPPGMGPFQTLAGAWKVAVARRGQPDADWEESERTSTIESLMDGALFQETFTSDGVDVIRTLSYDRFRKVYRVTSISSDEALMDVREGTLGEDGRLVATNLKTGTSDDRFGMTIWGRISIFNVAGDAFQVEQEVSIDGGETWFVAGRASYSRAGG